MRTAAACIAVVLCATCAHAQGFNFDGLFLGMTSKQLWQQIADGPWHRMSEEPSTALNDMDGGYMLTYSGTALPSLRVAFVSLNSGSVYMIELLTQLPPDSGLTAAEEWQQTIDSTKSLAHAIRRIYPQATGPAAIDEISLEAMLTNESRCNVAAVWQLGRQQIDVRTCGWLGETRGRYFRGSGKITVTTVPPQ